MQSQESPARGVSTLLYPHISGLGDQHGAHCHQETPKRHLSARSATTTLAFGLPLPPTCRLHERL
jgi:hypothetical protein